MNSDEEQYVDKMINELLKTFSSDEGFDVLMDMIAEPGYRPLEVTVTDPDTGEQLLKMHTARKPAEVEELIENIRRDAELPTEVFGSAIFKHINPTDDIQIGEAKLRDVIMKQIFGGRPASEEIAERNANIRREWADCQEYNKRLEGERPITKREFMEEFAQRFDLSMKQVQRILAEDG